MVAAAGRGEKGQLLIPAASEGQKLLLLLLQLCWGRIVHNTRPDMELEEDDDNRNFVCHSFWESYTKPLLTKINTNFYDIFRQQEWLKCQQQEISECLFLSQIFLPEKCLKVRGVKLIWTLSKIKFCPILSLKGTVPWFFSFTISLQLVSRFMYTQWF